MANKFVEMLQARWDAGARVCVGLDSDPTKLPDKLRHPTGYGHVDLFNAEIVQATADLALCYKPNIAFYSGKYAPGSLGALRYAIDKIRELAPGVPIILDSKRADIGNTNIGYVEEAFVSFDADAVTVNPYFGMEAMKPFLEQKDKGIIVLCRTSNPGAGQFQDLLILGNTNWAAPRPLYQHVARQVAVRWNYNNNCLLVVGATYPTELGAVRHIVGDMWLLVPGVGTQGGDVEAVIKNGLNSQNAGLIINSSSGIIFASKGDDYAEAARAKTLELTESINRAIKAKMEAAAPA